MLQVGIDCDGTIKNFAQRVVDVYKKDFPDHKVVPVSEWTKYPLEGYFPIGKGIYDYFINQRAREIYAEAEPYPGAVEFMRKMAGRAYVTIVTKQPNSNLDILTLNWLIKNQIAFDEIRYVQDKSKVKGLDVLLDDCTANLTGLGFGGTFPMCMDRPWNQDWEGLRVKSYDSFLSLYGMGDRK